MAMAAVAPPTTATLTLMDLPGTAYRLKKPISAFIEQDECGYFVVYEQNTGVFFHDHDLSRLLPGFFAAFIDQFEFLQRNKDHLAPSLEAELERFALVLEQREPMACVTT